MGRLGSDVGVMEFVMIYGWAIIVVILAVWALVYFNFVYEPPVEPVVNDSIIVNDSDLGGDVIEFNLSAPDVIDTRKLVDVVVEWECLCSSPSNSEMGLKYCWNPDLFGLDELRKDNYVNHLYEFLVYNCSDGGKLE